MLKIGHFAQIGQVTVKTLHHYDRLGILKPARIDPENGYRYYSASQLNDLVSILTLKDLDLSLEQIAEILKGSLKPTDLLGILKMKQAELRALVNEKEAKLARVEARLAQIAAEEYMTQDITIKKVDSVRVLAYRAVIPEPSVIKKTFDAVSAALRGAAIPLVDGPWLSLYYHDDYREKGLDFEIAIPVAGDYQGTLDIGSGRIMTPRDLPEETMACITIHMHGQQDVAEGNRALARWVEANGYQYAESPCRESYSFDPAPDGSVIFETQYPIIAER